jgi:hypothetical protein
MGRYRPALLLGIALQPLSRLVLPLARVPRIALCFNVIPAIVYGITMLRITLYRSRFPYRDRCGAEAPFRPNRHDGEGGDNRQLGQRAESVRGGGLDVGYYRGR